MKGPVMGALTEQAIARQLAKGQGETNDRLEKLIAEQKRTNELLDRLGAMLSGRP